MEYRKIRKWIWLKIKKFFKYVRRNFALFIIFIIWSSNIVILSTQPLGEANWSSAIILTAVLIFSLGNVNKEEEEYGKIKQDLKLLYDEYKRNIDLSIIIDQQRIREEKIKELPFSIYSIKFMSKVVERGMIKNKDLTSKIKLNLDVVTWFNRVWLILAKEVLLGNENLETRIREHLKFNNDRIYKKLEETKKLIKDYFEKEFSEELKA